MDPQRMEGKSVRYNLGHYSGCVCDFVCGQERNLGKPEGIPGNAAPDSARANRRLGLFYHDRKELTDAILHYRKALDILPNFPYAWNDLDGAYKDMVDLDRAKMHYNEVLNITPGWPEHTMASARSTVLAAGSTRRSWPMRRPFGGMKTTSRHTIIWRQFTRIVAGLTRQRNSGCVRWKSILNTGSRMKI